MALADAQRRLADNKSGQRSATARSSKLPAQQSVGTDASNTSANNFTPTSPSQRPPVAATYSPKRGSNKR